MTQLSVMDLAKQGDPQAIAALINRSLASKGIHAKAELEAECLKISLQAAQVPNQKAVVTIIHRGIIILQPEKVKCVKILTYRADNNYLAWQYEINLVKDLQQPLTASPDPESNSLEPNHNINLVSNPKGVILVQKLSQIKQNLQEYQDIIVRFTDEQVGTVRCLTTLTELIQVISKPSFLFAAVASNPNLRSLLDTIAESSKTDEHGDQVITNLSILQPGQQWQKAKIRLVTKIFLEPAQEEDDPEIKHQGITLDLAETTSESTAYDVADTKPATISDIPQNIPAKSVDTNVDTNIASVSPSTSVTISSLFDNTFDDAPASSAPILQITNDIVERAESITANSLFDDFQAEPAPVPVASIPELPVLETPVPLVNSVVESLESITANSLFDNFQEETPVQIVDDITASSDFSDSLFDEFMNEHIESVSNYSESINQVNDLPVNSSASPLNDTASTSDDLFGSFANDLPAPPLESDVTEIEESIDTIKSRIPKQNLDKLLQLIQEEEQNQVVSSPSVNQDVNQLNTDVGVITIERILGNMDTISINTSENKSSSNLTLEDFSEDLNSVGF